MLTGAIGWGTDVQLIGCLEIWGMSKRSNKKRRLGKWLAISMRSFQQLRRNTYILELQASYGSADYSPIPSFSSGYVALTIFVESIRDIGRGIYADIYSRA